MVLQRNGCGGECFASNILVGCGVGVVATVDGIGVESLRPCCEGFESGDAQFRIGFFAQSCATIGTRRLLKRNCEQVIENSRSVDDDAPAPSSMAAISIRRSISCGLMAQAAR